MIDASLQPYVAPQPTTSSDRTSAAEHEYAMDLAARLAARVAREGTHELRLARALMLDVIELLKPARSAKAQEWHPSCNPCAALPLPEEDL